MEECKLRAANGVEGVECDAEACVYWRLVEQLDLPDDDQERSGCAIQHFELLEGADKGVTRWLLSVKQRIEDDGR